MPGFQSGGAKLHYELEGEGPLLVLLHNGFYSSASWDHVVPYLKDRFTCVRWDRWGYGKSARGMALRADIGSGCEELDDLLDHLETLGVDSSRPRLLGHCMGGAIAAAWTADHPGRVPALVLESTGFFSDDLLRRKVEVVVRPWEDLPEDLRKTLVRMHGPLKAPEAWNFIMTYTGGYIMQPEYDLRPALARIDCPTLVATGTRDVYFRPAHTREGFRHLRRAELWLPEGIGHDVHHEIPGEFGGRVADWLLT
jgi:pimeloyl-ACP methyl ester carboxylesterase